MLSTTSEYALRALIELAQTPDGAMVLGKHLSEKARIPANYLSKILLTLRRAGLVHAARGACGGYRLQKEKREIYLIDVIELFDGVRSRPACVLDKNRECDQLHPCTAHEQYRRARGAYIQFLESTSIADISKGTPRGAQPGKKPRAKARASKN